MKNNIENKVKWKDFIKDVVICSLGSYGGPEAHFGVFTDQLVIKKGYLKEEEMIELMALTTILPGPSSTQTIVAIGYKIGGPILALLTIIIWALPFIMLMTLLSFLSEFLISNNIGLNKIRFIGPMALGFIIMGAYRIGTKVIKDKTSIILLLLSAVVTYFIREPWIYPSVIIIGGLISLVIHGESKIWNRVKITPKWIYLILFLVFALGSIILNVIFDNVILKLFESFYRYGYMVIGGGQVVIPFMYSDLVEINNYMTNQEFLTGYGIVQGLPGPMFSFSSYVGGMAARGSGLTTQILSGIISGVAIFLPGTLLIYFVYPIWNYLKKIKAIKIALKGFTSVSAGLIIASAIILMQKNGLRLDNILITLGTMIMLGIKKIPAPIIVILVIIIGFIF